MQQPKQFADVEFRAKDLIIQLKNEGFSGFQIQIIGTQLWDAGAIMAFDAARLGTGSVPPLPKTPQHGTVTETSAGTIVRVGPDPDQKTPPPPAVQPNSQKKGDAAAAIGAGAPAPAELGRSPPQGAEQGPTEGDLYICQKCFGVVSANDKKLSMLFFNKTLCRTCNDKERIKTLKERETQVNKK